MIASPHTRVPEITFRCPDNDFFTDLRNREFHRLLTSGQHYLDYTGGGLYGASQIREHYHQLAEGVFGNPHSINPTSKVATDRAEAARAKVLSFFNAGEDYYCVFTANASASLKIIGECFPWTENSEYLLLTDNHNSVNGIREYCRGAGGTFRYAPVCSHNLTIDEDSLADAFQKQGDAARLFAFPAQSNVSGVKHNLKWIKEAKDAGWYTLLDAAAYVPTNQLDLQQVQPDFVCLSFYKMFGYPTGIGALLIRKTALGVLKKRWFAGGNVRMVGVKKPEHLFNDNHEQFENGTINYLGLPAVTTGLEFLESVGMDRIKARVHRLAVYLYQRLENLKHSDGRPMVQLYGPKDRSLCGGTVILNVLDVKGVRYCFRVIEARAADHNISIRTGCFCNPGLDEINNRITPAELEDHFTIAGGMAHSDIIAQLSSIRGATRASVGIASVKEDVDAFVAMLTYYRDREIE